MILLRSSILLFASPRCVKFFSIVSSLMLDNLLFERFNFFEAKPKFYWSKFNQAFMRNPSVHNLWSKDLYISPIQVIRPEFSKNGNSLKLNHWEQADFENYVIKFIGYELDNHEAEQLPLRITAVLNVTIDDLDYTVKPAIIIDNNYRKSEPAHLPQTDREIYLKEINVDDKSISLLVKNHPTSQIDREQNKEILAVEITEKPLINILWSGTLFLIAGIFISLINRLYISKL